jgi:Ca2+-binding RTX toxin-like protein
VVGVVSVAWGTRAAPVSADPVWTCQGQVATIVGTEGDDTLTGTGGDDVVWPSAGIDTFYGGAGNDGSDWDTAYAGPGHDTCSAGRRFSCERGHTSRRT